MKATEILYEEHRIIMKVLECLQKIVDESEAEGKLNAKSARSAVDFFRNFADGCHHAKEEDRLFVVMQDRGIPREGGPIGVMLMEHDSGRQFVRGMDAAIGSAAEGNPESLKNFGDHAGDFIALLTAHIAKEDQVLFPMADNVLDASAAENLLNDFKRIESSAGGKRHSAYIEVARDLCERYHIPFLDEKEVITLKTELQA